MYAFGERTSGPGDSSGRKREREDYQSDTPERDSQANPPKQRILEPNPVAASAPPDMNSAAISFESKIALALGGSSWQQLQGDSAVEPTIAAEDGVDSDSDGGDAILEIPEEEVIDPVVLEKRRRKLARFNSTIARDAGHVVETIEKTALIPVPEPVTWDEEPELLCCYNWQAAEDGTNTIFVPGEPAKWQPPSLPHTVERDSGWDSNDYNYARQPKNPYLPMFNALRVMSPNTTFHNVDVLADRNNLRVLLEFAQGKNNAPLRLNLYLVFNTLVIVRRESRWWKRSDGKSYGFNFERAFTKKTEDMEDATSHYRAIRYAMGPLNVVCRFEADAYDDGIIPDDLTQTEAAAVSGSSHVNPPRFNYNAPIRVLQKGHIVPTAQILELKTQAYSPLASGLVACQDQLWFGRTSLLYTAPYEKGTGVVSRIKEEVATVRVKTWEQNQQEPLRKLAALLIRLRDVLKRENRPNRALILVREEKGGPIVLRTMEERSWAVDRETRETFWPLPTHGNRGRGGGRGRGAYNSGPRGRGNFAPAQGRGDFAAPRGRGYFTPGQGRESDFAPSRGRGQFVPGHGRGDFTPSRGRGQFTSGQSRGGDSANLRGRGYYAQPQGRGQHHSQRGSRQ